MVLVNVIVGIFTALCFIGAVGEWEDMKLKKFLERGFYLCVIAIIVLNVFSIMR